MSVPLPGALHFYDDEPRAGWMHAGAALGVASIIVGAAIVDEKDNAWKKTDLEIVDVMGANGTVERYEHRTPASRGVVEERNLWSAG